MPAGAWLIDRLGEPGTLAAAGLAIGSALFGVGMILARGPTAGRSHAGHARASLNSLAATNPARPR